MHGLVTGEEIFIYVWKIMRKLSMLFNRLHGLILTVHGHGMSKVKSNRDSIVAQRRSKLIRKQLISMAPLLYFILIKAIPMRKLAIISKHSKRQRKPFAWTPSMYLPIETKE